MYVFYNYNKKYLYVLIIIIGSYFFIQGGTEAAVELRKELATLRLRVETLEVELKNKDEELKRLSLNKQPHEDRCKVIPGNTVVRFYWLLDESWVIIVCIITFCADTSTRECRAASRSFSCSGTIRNSFRSTRVSAQGNGNT